MLVYILAGWTTSPSLLKSKCCCPAIVIYRVDKLRILDKIVDGVNRESCPRSLRSWSRNRIGFLHPLWPKALYSCGFAGFAKMSYFSVPPCCSALFPFDDFTKIVGRNCWTEQKLTVYHFLSDSAICFQIIFCGSYSKSDCWWVHVALIYLVISKKCNGSNGQDLCCSALQFRLNQGLTDRGFSIK